MVTVALGSTLSSVILDQNIPLAEGLTAFAALVFLQLVITWFSVRFKLIDHLVKAEPTKLVENGKLQRDAMKHERITEDEIFAAIRKNNHDSLDRVQTVVLETNGTINVIFK